MLVAKNLERLIELETDLKSKYDVEINEKMAQIAKAVAKQEEFQATIAKQKLTLADQQQKITELSAATTETKRIEQLNRELNSQSSNLQEEVASQKKRIKSLQKDLAVEREELKGLKQFDVNKMKKNLDAGKKKLAEKTADNDLLQKSYNKFKKENEELKQSVKELEEKVAETEKEEEKEVAEA